MEQSTTNRSWLLIGVAVGAITLLGAVFRFSGAGHSLRLDELTSAWVVNTGWAEVAARAWLNNHTPAYFYIAKACVFLFGYNEIALRLPSLLAGVAVIPLSYLLALRLSRSVPGAILGAFLVAADSIFIEYSQDARAYSLLQLLTVVQVLFFLRLLNAPARAARAGYVLCTAGLFYLHYTSAILVLGEAAFVILRAARGEAPNRYRPTTLTIDGLWIALLCLPLIPHLRYLFHGRTVLQQFMRPVVLEDLLTLYPLGVYLLYPAAVALLAEYARRGVRGQGSGVSEGEPAGGGKAPVADTQSSVLSPQSSPLTPWAFLCCWFLLPLAAVWLANRLDVVRLFRVRYTIVCSPVPILAAALAVTAFRSRAARLTYVIALLLLTQATEGPARRFLRDGTFSKHDLEDWRSAIGFVRAADPAAAKPVFVRSGLVEADWLARHPDERLAEYCLSPANSLYPLPGRLLRPLPYSSEVGITEADRQLIERLGGAWLVVRGSKAQAEQIARRIQQEPAQAWSLAASEFRGVTVIEMMRR